MHLQRCCVFIILIKDIDFTLHQIYIYDHWILCFYLMSLESLMINICSHMWPLSKLTLTCSIKLPQTNGQTENMGPGNFGLRVRLGCYASVQV